MGFRSLIEIEPGLPALVIWSLSLWPQGKSPVPSFLRLMPSLLYHLLRYRCYPWNISSMTVSWSQTFPSSYSNSCPCGLTGYSMWMNYPVRLPVIPLTSSLPFSTSQPLSGSQETNSPPITISQLNSKFQTTYSDHHFLSFQALRFSVYTTQLFKLIV